VQGIFVKILVNGSSVSRGPQSWPYFIQQHYDCDLVNLSQAGAGNHYISDTVINELSQREYDLVVIMWADLRRYDVKVKNIDYFQDTIYTSKYQKTMNDWPEKITWPVNDQDLVDDDWVFGCGYLNEQDPSVVELFDSYYQHTDLESQYFSSYMKIIALQSFLQHRAQPYVFCGVRRLARLERFTSLYNLLDFGKIVNDTTPHEIAKSIDSWDSDQMHPGPQAHEIFAQHLTEFIEHKKILHGSN
jgi:hypothetical protein